LCLPQALILNLGHRNMASRGHPAEICRHDGMPLPPYERCCGQASVASSHRACARRREHAHARKAAVSCGRGGMRIL
jgi:hypothetical protein